MLQTMVDFTIPKSYCNLYYQKLNGEVLFKSYKKKAQTKFYVNGYVLRKYDTPFRKIDKEEFLNNLN